MTRSQPFNTLSTLPQEEVGGEAEVEVGEEEEISQIEGIRTRIPSPQMDPNLGGQQLATLMFRIISKNFASTIICTGGAHTIVLTPWFVSGPRFRQHLAKNL